MNQQRLESFLSASSNSSLDISDRFETSSQKSADFAAQTIANNGTDTPRDLNARLKILELYTLHVLPRNEEWQYAREFIGMSDVFDEERREEFLQILQSLEDQRSHERDNEAEITRQKEEALRREREELELRRQEEAKLLEARSKEQQVPKGHKRSDSEIDYGIEDPYPGKLSKKTNMAKTSKPFYPSHTRLSRSPPPKKKMMANKGVYERGLAFLASLQQLLLSIARSTTNNPTILLRTILFLVALVVALSRRDVKERIRRITGVGWGKLKSTVGMGVKVSYI
jgi:hypothetical protein